MNRFAESETANSMKAPNSPRKLIKKPEDWSDLEVELKKQPDRQAQQLKLIEFINKQTGSSFTGFNLNDPLGRFIGSVLWPVTPERVKTITDLGPTLSALLLASPLHQIVWDFGPNHAFAFPDTLLHRTPAYQHVYKTAGMHYIACYDYPPDERQNHVLVVVSRSDRAFSTTEIHALQAICDHFESVINRIEGGKSYFPNFSQAIEHSVELDEKQKPKAISPYTHALIALFYGPLREDHSLLPQCLLDDITRSKLEYGASVLPAVDGFHFAFTKRSQGRLLCVVVNSTPKSGTKLTLYEDLKQLERLRRVKDACRKLKRDRYSVLTACFALLDGARDEVSVRQNSGLTSHKASSARRIISKAQFIVDAT